MPKPKKLLAREFAAGTRVIASREMEAYFDAPIAYIYASVFLVLSCSIFMNAFFLNGLVDMSPFFEVLPFLLILFIPAITMRVWAEERANNTYELLMTLPLQPLQIVLGKYTAAILFYLIVLQQLLCHPYLALHQAFSCQVYFQFFSRVNRQF